LKRPKYNISKHASKILFVATLILCITYVILLISENTYAISANKSDANYGVLLVIIDVTKNIALVCISVFLSSFISTLLIEKNNLNSMYCENINELFENTHFYNHLNDKQKFEMLENIEKYIYPFNNDVKTAMINKIRHKLLTSNDEFYYEDCQTTVSCNIYSDIIEKNIKRVMKIRSYNGKQKLSHFIFASTTLEKIDDCECFKIKSITVNGKIWNYSKDFVQKSRPVEVALHKKGGYNIKYECEAKKPIEIVENKDTTIEINYTTTVKNTDTVFTLRVKEHCKKFSIKFKISSSEQYNIFANGFGFLDDAKKTLNDDDSNDISLVFDDWIYKGDGVALSFQKK